jgi:hypothetical protein
MSRIPELFQLCIPANGFEIQWDESEIRVLCGGKE